MVYINKKERNYLKALFNSMGDIEGELDIERECKKSILKKIG